MTEDPSHASEGSHQDADGGSGHEDADGGSGHEDDGKADEKPRAAVLGGFLAVNGVVLAAAGATRRRDRARAAAKAPFTTASRKDASR